MSERNPGIAMRWAALFAVVLGITATPSVAHASEPEFRIVETTDGAVRVSHIAGQLERPWSLAFLPNGDILVTERVGRLRIVRSGQLDPAPIAGLPEVHAHLHGGLLDVAVHPAFEQNGLIYFTYARAGDLGATVALARGHFDGFALSDVQDIFVADAWSTSDVHYGSRIAFGRDGTVFVSIGERNERERAQNLTDHAGTIVRIRDDGSVPDDNPFVGQHDTRPEIYSYGHRNVQGLAINPFTGALWANEHGPQGGDEVNVVLAGHNYGWPLATLGREYNGARVSPLWHAPGTDAPITFWTPSIGVSGMAFYTGRPFAAWTGNLFVGGLAGRQLDRLLFAETAQYGHESLLSELRARIRDVRQGPDELLYVLTDDDEGMLLRLEPLPTEDPEGTAA